MKREKYLVIGNDSHTADTVITFIVDATSSDAAITLVLKEINNTAMIGKLKAFKHKDIPKLVEEEETVFDLLKKGYTDSAFHNIVTMYEKMIINRSLSLGSLKDLFSPYLVLYDEKREQFFVGDKISKNVTNGIGTTKLVQLGFRFLPKKYNEYDLNNNVFDLCLKSLHPDPEQENHLEIRDRINQIIQITDFFKHFRTLIPDLPLRFEKIMIDKL